MNKTYKEIEEMYLDTDTDDIPFLLTVTEDMRSLYFKAKGTYRSDTIIRNWYTNLNVATPGEPHNTAYSIAIEALTTPVSDGSATDFYDIIGCKDVDDLAEHWNLKGDEFNCLKAIVGIALGARHSGTNPKRDANKLVHYANRIKNRLDK